MIEYNITCKRCGAIHWYDMDCPKCEFDYEGELKGVLIERLAAELGQTCAQVQEWAYAETNRIMNEEMHNV